jgi:hypothetical protein
MKLEDILGTLQKYKLSFYSLRELINTSCYSKASTMDSHYGPAWIGFGHSFAVESEHDQAITAYSTAVKLYEG